MRILLLIFSNMAEHFAISYAYNGMVFKITINDRAFYINRSTARKFVGSDDISKESILDKVKSNISDFLAVFYDTQKIR